MGAVDEAFKSVMPPPAMMEERGSAGMSGGIEGAGGAGCRSLGSALCVYKILKMELECVRHCDRIWIMVVKYIKIYLTTV